MRTDLELMVALARAYVREEHGTLEHVKEYQGHQGHIGKMVSAFKRLQQTGRGPVLTVPWQKADRASLSPQGVDVYDALRSLGASHQVAFHRAKTKHGLRVSRLDAFLAN